MAAGATPSRSTTTSRPTRTWPSASARCSGSGWPRTSTGPTAPGPSPSSGAAGTSPSPWLRDYVFLPTAYSVSRWVEHLAMLRGTRQRDLATDAVATMATMLVAGLWHGAGGTFACWGALIGAYMVLSRATKPARSKLVRRIGLKDRPRAHAVLQVAVVFVLRTSRGSSSGRAASGTHSTSWAIWATGSRAPRRDGRDRGRVARPGDARTVADRELGAGPAAVRRRCRGDRDRALGAAAVRPRRRAAGPRRRPAPGALCRARGSILGLSMSEAGTFIYVQF